MYSADVLAQAMATISLGLLAASGVAKLVDPAPTSGAMAAARLPSSTGLSRTLGVAEVVTAVTALVVGGPALPAAALLYGSFAWFTFRALRGRFPVQSCGCFGREDTPPTATHVIYNVGSVAGLGFVAATGRAPIDWTMGTGSLVLYLAFAVVGVYASFLLLSALPRLLALTKAS